MGWRKRIKQILALVLNDLKERGLEAQSRKYAYEIKKYQEIKEL